MSAIFPGTNFSTITNNTAQRGTALQLFQTTNGSQYILYYFDLSQSNYSNGMLWRTVSTNWSPVVIASNLINTLYFQAEDYNGNVATNQGSSTSYKNIVHTQTAILPVPVSAHAGGQQLPV